MPEPESLQPKRIRWYAAAVMALVVGAIIYVVWVDPWLEQRAERKRLAPIMKELRAAVIAQERCLLGHQLPAKGGLAAVYEAFFTSRFGERQVRCTRTFGARATDLSERLRQAAPSDTEDVRDELESAVEKASQRPFSGRLSAELATVCEMLRELRWGFDRATKVLGGEPLDATLTTAQRIATCSPDPQELNDLEVRPPGPADRVLRSWVRDDTLYYVVRNVDPDYDDKASNWKRSRIDAYRKPVAGAWQKRQLDDSWDASWDGAVLWGIGATKQDRLTRVHTSAGDRLIVGTALPNIPGALSNDADQREHIAWEDARRGSTLPLRMRATGDTRSLMAYDGGYYAIRIADAGKGAATAVRFAPQLPVTPAITRLRIAADDAFIVLRAMVADDKMTFLAHTLPPAGEPTATRLELGELPTGDMLACAAGKHNWVFAGGQVVLYSADDGASWKRVAVATDDTHPTDARAMPLFRAATACTDRALFVFGSDGRSVASWTRCTPERCAPLTPFAYAAPRHTRPSFGTPTAVIAGSAASLLFPYEIEDRRGGAALFRFDLNTGKPAYVRAFEGWPYKGTHYWLIGGHYLWTHLGYTSQY